ncbi:Alpha-L-fucosidase [Aphelenchoides besseyi]|nr:Alpha-L-fucosidase [Aphelenchoides besseyi]
MDLFLNHADGYLPGHLLRRKWECCMSVDVKTTNEVLSIFIRVLAWGGNLLLNVGPNHLGRIDPIFEDRLRNVGKFVAAYEEAIFDTKPWIHQNDSNNIWYTSKLRSSTDHTKVFNSQSQVDTIIFAFILNYNGQVQLPSIKTTAKTTITLLGTKEKVQIVSQNPTTVILPAWQLFPFRDVVVLKVEYAADSKFQPKVYDF